MERDSNGLGRVKVEVGRTPSVYPGKGLQGDGRHHRTAVATETARPSSNAHRSSGAFGENQITQYQKPGKNEE